MKVYLLVAVLVFGLTVAGKLLLDGRSPSTDNLPTIELALQSPCDLRQGRVRRLMPMDTAFVSALTPPAFH